MIITKKFTAPICVKTENVDNLTENILQISIDLIREKGIWLDLVARVSEGELLNIVLHYQIDSSIERTKMWKKNNEVLR